MRHGHLRQEFQQVEEGVEPPPDLERVLHLHIGLVARNLLQERLPDALALRPRRRLLVDLLPAEALEEAAAELEEVARLSGRVPDLKKSMPKVCQSNESINSAHR